MEGRRVGWREKKRPDVMEGRGIGLRKGGDQKGRSKRRSEVEARKEGSQNSMVMVCFWATVLHLKSCP